MINNISFDEINDDADKIKPSGFPLIDMFLMKNFGLFVEKKIANEKWKICPDIAKKFYEQISEKIPDIIEYNEIAELINKFRLEYKDTSFLSSAIDEIMTNALRKIYWVDKKIKENIDKYFESKNIVQDIIKDIINQYNEEWNLIQKNFDIMEEKFGNNFENIEEDQRYIEAQQIIENINNTASDKVDNLRKETIELIKIEYQKYVHSITELYKFQSIFDDIKNNFSKQVDDIYYKVLVEYRYDNKIIDDIVSFFSVEKSMHKLNFSFDLVELTLQNLKK
jgi:DNA-binding XRE family transcriptional regulator